MTIPTIIQNQRHKELESDFKKAYMNLFAAYNKVFSVDYVNTDYSGTVNADSDLAEALYAEFKGAKKLSDTNFSRDLYVGNIKTYTLKSGGRPECSQPFRDTSIMAIDGSTIDVMYNCGTSWVTLDTNGVFKKPNAYGHDVFIFTISNEGKLTPAASETGATKDENGQWVYYYSSECNKNGTTKLNGVACAAYALLNKCPDDATKTYWECLP